jgi:carboxyl-terminal processing protease
MKSIKLLFLILVVFLGITSSCKKNSDNTNGEIKDFIWKGLNEAYLWVDLVPNLSSTKYSSQTSLNNFLNTYDDPETLFYDLLYKYGEVDKWSWIVKDYTELENSFQGITKSMGFEFGLARISGSNDIFGFVFYVVKGGPADKAGMKRGDIFMKINDTPLTVSNYQSLLYDQSSYKIGFATIVNSIISPNNKSLNLTAEEVHENPIYLDTVYNINSKKIGYLVYNGFMSDYDIALNNVISKFKTAGIEKLIVDLRYDGGGSVRTATYLASMIYGKYTSKVFLMTHYNNTLQTYLTSQYGSGFFEENFTDNIDAEGTNPITPINTLNLTDVYILTTENTASASELLINCLKPYMNVITVGTNTHGKYVASITIKDYISENVVNPNHKWAMQPIVLKISNKDGVTDFVNGLTPTIAVEEDIANLLPFGDINEIMLKTALNSITGSSSSIPVMKSKAMGLMEFINSKQLRPHAQEMYVKEIPNILH